MACKGASPVDAVRPRARRALCARDCFTGRGAGVPFPACSRTRDQHSLSAFLNSAVSISLYRYIATERLEGWRFKRAATSLRAMSASRVAYQAINARAFATRRRREGDSNSLSDTFSDPTTATTMTSRESGTCLGLASHQRGALLLGQQGVRHDRAPPLEAILIRWAHTLTHVGLIEATVTAAVSRQDSPNRRFSQRHGPDQGSLQRARYRQHHQQPRSQFD